MTNFTFLEEKTRTSTLFSCSCEKPSRLIEHFQSTLNEFTILTDNTKTLIEIGSHTYNRVHFIEELGTLTHLIKSRWFCVQEIVLNDDASRILLSDISSSRTFLNQALIAIIEGILLHNNPAQKEKLVEQTLKHLKIIFSGIVPLKKFKENVLFKIAGSTSSINPTYQYLHTLLEVHYYFLVLHYVCTSTTENIERNLEVIINNLGLISKAQFIKTSTCNSGCICINYFWLAVQLIIEKVDATGALFWKVFNKVLEKETPLFALAFLKEISFIQCYNADFEEEGTKCSRIKSNYEFLDFKFKELLYQANCDTLIQGFKVIEPLVCKLWLKEGNINIFQVIWDFYSKRLNVSNRDSCNTSAFHIIETVDQILCHPTNCKDDFEIYVGLLLFHLREHPVQWGKMKGRIYSQLGPNKVKDLSDVGLKHVILLYLALSTVNFEELEKKIIAFLENLPVEKKFTSLVWNLHSALILKYVKEGRSIEKICQPMIKILHEASMDQKMFHLIKEFVKNFEHIILYSTNMQLHQWLLIGPWLGKYQSVCYYADLNQSLDVILLLLDKCSDADSWSYWETSLKNNFYPNLRHLAGMSNAPIVIGTIAGKLAILYTNLTTEAFAFFNSETISPKISSKFLEVILTNYPNNLMLTSQQERIIVQSWVKICLLTTDSQCDLTKNVAKLDIFPSTLKSILINTSKPMQSFIEYLGTNSKQLNFQSHDVVNLCDLAFNDLDKILIYYISKPESEEITINIYHYIALIILHCGNIIYNRNKAVTPLTKLIQTLLLPMDFLMGKKTPHTFIINSIKKTWHIFFEGFVNLNTNKDSYLERTLKDFVVRYIPYYSTFDSPIVSMLDKPKYAEVILEKINLCCFKPPIKESDANVLKALKILSDLVNSTTSLPLFKIIINKTLYGLFEVVIFHSQRSTAISVIKSITSSHLFTDSKPEFNQAVWSITEKNLGLNTINYFQLVICLAKFAPNEIRALLGDIKLQVANVERLRGVGFDKSLRLQVEKLEMALQNNS